MDEIAVPAYAKINLTLRVLGQRPDGYHDLSSIFQSVSLADEVRASRGGRGIELIAEGADLPPLRQNLVYRAAALLDQRCGLPGGVRLTLKKKVPVAAGLGGGSADAAAALLALNYLCGLGLTPGQLLWLAAELGSDVPFCLLGGTALGRGRGERLQVLPASPRLWLVLVKPDFGVATADVYRAWDQGLGRQSPAGPDEVLALAALEQGDAGALVSSLGNDLEAVTLSLHPRLRAVREALLAAGANKAVMCGSGPTFFAVTAGEEAAAALAGRLRSAYKQVHIAHTL